MTGMPTKTHGISSGIHWCEVIIMYKKLVEYDYTRKQPILSDKTPYRCRFCEEIKGPDEFKKIAHAVAECIGNKAIISSYECDKCNHRFSAYESELGKLYTFYRANRSIRKKGGGKTKLPGTNIEYSEKDSTYSETINLTDNPYDCILVGTYKNGTDFFFKSRKITVNGPFVYRALLKFSLSIAPENLCSYLSSGFHILKKDEIFSQPVLEIVRKNIISKPKIRLYQYDGAAQYPRWFSCIDVFQITYILFLDFEMQPNFLPYPIIAESIESPIISPDDIFAIQIRDFSRNVTIEQAEQVSGHIKY